ncbi:MAG: S49 family peptidase [Pseudomonadota bacterium]
MSDTDANKINNMDLTADLVKDLIKERRRDRCWRNLRFFAGFALFLVVVIGFFTSNSPSMSDSEPGAGKDYVAMLRLNGIISPDSSFSAEQVVPQLRQAFTDKDAKGIILDIDSGGGTPVQAAIIHDEIVKLKKKYHKKVVVIGEDMLASGAYYVAVSGDKIYVNANTITGSIGVIMAGFGFPETIKKIGVERRVYAAGDHKDRLDEFLPVQADDTQKIHNVLDEVHTNFIQVVTAGRQGKLVGDTKEIFSGDFWTGESAVKLGLADGLGNLWDVMQNEFKVSRFKDYTAEGDIIKTLANKMGAMLGLPLRSEQMRLFEKF